MPRTDPAAAEQEMRAAGGVPQVPFPGVNRPWLVVHVDCGRETSPSLANVRRRGGVCAPCGAVKRGAKRKEGLAAVAIAKMRECGWETLVPYAGADVPWLSKHLACGNIRSPTLNTVRSKPDSCMNCYRMTRGYLTWTEESALAKFAEVGLTPLVPYPASSAKPWRARHDACGRVVAPRLANVAHGQGPCRECGHEASKSATRLDLEIVEAFMRRAGLEPVAEYPGVDLPWRCIHTSADERSRPPTATSNAVRVDAVHAVTHEPHNYSACLNQRPGDSCFAATSPRSSRTPEARAHGGAGTRAGVKLPRLSATHARATGSVATATAHSPTTGLPSFTSSRTVRR